jgi:hypothetical protein
VIVGHVLFEHLVELARKNFWTRSSHTLIEPSDKDIPTSRTRTCDISTWIEATVVNVNQNGFDLHFTPTKNIVKGILHITIRYNP